MARRRIRKFNPTTGEREISADESAGLAQFGGPGERRGAALTNFAPVAQERARLGQAQPLQQVAPRVADPALVPTPTPEPTQEERAESFFARSQARDAPLGGERLRSVARGRLRKGKRQAIADRRAGIERQERALKDIQFVQPARIAGKAKVTAAILAAKQAERVAEIGAKSDEAVQTLKNTGAEKLSLITDNRLREFKNVETRLADLVSRQGQNQATQNNMIQLQRAYLGSFESIARNPAFGDKESLNAAIGVLNQTFGNLLKNTQPTAQQRQTTDELGLTVAERAPQAAPAEQAPAPAPSRAPAPREQEAPSDVENARSRIAQINLILGPGKDPRTGKSLSVEQLRSLESTRKRFEGILRSEGKLARNS